MGASGEPGGSVRAGNGAMGEGGETGAVASGGACERWAPRAAKPARV